jgi:hypothetical protein
MSANPDRRPIMLWSFALHPATTRLNPRADAAALKP